MTTFRNCVQCALALLLLVAFCDKTPAQDYPSRPVTIIVPVAAGGSIDTIARLVAQKLSDRLGQPFVIENRTGAGMVIGTSAVAKATPDGYTMLLASSSALAINVTVHKALPYDPLKDFVPVAHVANSPFTLAVNLSLPVNSVPELIKYAKDKPGELSYGTAGPGSPHHLFTELLKTKAGIEMIHVPYRGNVPAMTDLVAGHIQVVFSDPSGLPLIKERKVRPLGVSTLDRLPSIPNVPPLAEAGVPGFDAAAWVMLALPAATPKPIVDRLNTEMKTIATLPDVREAMANNSVIPVETPPPDELQRFLAAEIARWGQVVRQAGIAGSE
ncbi:Bug family tripartite tricarboxylate transporter substrate binding protein [Rhodoplanes sp. Z2-YC6860]|uniref:Bug family tripartite tricarboxylate transporter substrate binding protein n=1 Tax=Rhodoplanes sp. Z2-YC6860 TaxID=674703 RepID=UPI00078B6950|nr:tripartite tricarboxylate transporter substrate binding protein [Rhodoplanes sp. Z2-YC6860]AMN42361.1 extra-cytoplasmic solute receptor protein [Rhodoplanes sp. Z2-YC6860]